MFENKEVKQSREYKDLDYKYQKISKEYHDIQHKDKIVKEYKNSINGIAKIFLSAFTSFIITLLLNNYPPIRDWLNSFELSFNYSTGIVAFPIGQFLFYIILCLILGIILTVLFSTKTKEK